MYTDTDSWFVGDFHDNNFKQDKYRLKAFGGYGVLNLDFSDTWGSDYEYEKIIG